MFWSKKAAEPAHTVTVTAGQGPDRLYADLERAMAQSTAITVEGCLRDDAAWQALTRFVGRYKLLLASCQIDADTPGGGQCRLRLNTTWDPQAPKKSYAALEGAYTENYYLMDCGGYERFVTTRGEQIDGRLQGVLCLVDPRPGQKILDIGCGRGELSCALAKQGADVTGLDYSPAAIAIAERTYRAAQAELRLRYRRQDIFEAQDLGTYDKMVMADVVEHIEQDVLEKIFEKLSRALRADGTLIIHTAPNRHYYEQAWPLRRRQAAALGCWLPQEPRSYYEQLMHINEQTPEGLRAALERYFPFVHVWTGGVMDCAARKDRAQQAQDLEIFAYAANSAAALEAALAESARVPRPESCRLGYAAQPLTAVAGQEAMLDVAVENLGGETVTSHRQHPVFLCYHILDAAGRAVVYDGERSPIALLRPGARQTVPLRVAVPADLPQGAYTLRITAVAEGLFWLDDRCASYCDVPLEIR